MFGRGEGAGGPAGGRRRPPYPERLLEESNDAVLVTEGGPLDEPGPRVVYANAAFSRITGYSSEEIVGRSPRVLQGPGTDRARIDEIRAALEAGDPVRTELLNYRKDGTPYWVELSIAPVRDEAGRTERWLSVQRETTARVEAEGARLEAERRLRSVLARYGSDMVIILEPDGTPRYESPAVERALGYRHKELAAGDVFRFVHPDDVEGISRSVAEALRKPGESPPVEFRMKHADGSWRWFESSKNNLSGDPDVGGVVVVTRDVTERKRAEVALTQSEARLGTVARSAPVILFALDAEGVFTFEEGAALGDIGTKPSERVGRSFFESYPDHPEIRENVRRALSGEEVVATVELAGRAYHTTYSPQRDGRGRVTGLIGVATDVTERRRLEEELRHRVLHDDLTGLPNRALFFDRLEHALEGAHRGGDPTCLLFVDVDGFKNVNDSLGHGAGDELLVGISRRLEGCVRPSDSVARFGGDEFAVLLERCPPERAAEVAERIEEELARPFAIGDREAWISASVGRAHSTAADAGAGTEVEAARLLGEADRAMYARKKERAERSG